MLCSDRWKWDIKLLQVNKTMGRGNLPEQWIVLMAPCSDSRSVWVGHRTVLCRGLVVLGIEAVESSLSGSSSLCVQLCVLVLFWGLGKMCWSGFLSSLLPCLASWWWQRMQVCTHSVIITMKNLKIHFTVMRVTGSWRSEVLQVVLPIHFTFPVLNTER